VTVPGEHNHAARASALVMDLDGTLIDSRERVSPVVARAVREAAALVPVAIASGREPDDVVRFARLLGLNGPQVSDNGARIVDAITGRTLEEYPLDSIGARRIVETLEKRGVPFYAVDAGRLARTRAEIAEWRVTIIAAHALTLAGAVELAADYADVPEVSAVPSLDASGARAFVNFNRGGVNKGTGVLRLARMIGVDPALAVAVGDSANDVDMFASVGTSVAMGNARDEVKREADHVVAGVAEDGLAEAVERFVLCSPARPGGVG